MSTWGHLHHGEMGVFVHPNGHVCPEGAEGHFEDDVVGEVEDDTFEKSVYEAFNSARELLLRKHQDYGPKGISNAPGGPLNGLRVRLHDKFARINHLIDAGVAPENESLRDSFLDAANYCVIALLVLDGRWPGAPR
jgi:hypothetical protein